MEDLLHTAEVADTAQKIINTPLTDTVAIENILSSASIATRGEVIHFILTNQSFRMLYPEYAAYFDKRSV
jgi:hypothetical protein